MEHSQLKRAKRQLASWGTGRTGPVDNGPAQGTRTATVVLESAAQLPPVLASDFVGHRTVVFVPDGQDGGPVRQADPQAPGAVGPLVVRYEGSLAEPGDEMSVGDSFFLQTQDYATSEYMSVIGPTLIRITEEADFDGYLADADRARNQGTFADFATDPAVRIGDLSALGAGPAGDGPFTRLYVRSNGEVSLSSVALPLGTVADGGAALAAEWTRLNSGSAHPCAVSLGLVVPDRARTDALTARPWLGRYLAALDAVRELRSRGITGLEVSGFGARLVPGLAELGDSAADRDDVDAPLLLWTGEQAVVHSARTGRFFSLGRAAAELAETLLVHGSVEAAAAHADRAALTQVETLFASAGVRLTVATAAAR
ncbi:daptide biosynthesis RiPP recognition protein [Streptomyces sp. F8]|uniref:daptide biosynthesis RiPP recognition protein n=1 Tax=Streptomyces sp. F8 TaxID=1436085 RepID=UPI0029CEA194|nr:daptide biosynthesis RiPP recognition protein [Streptomyces sp. F8]MDX6758058.1 daptide biosynthesis RiPP recognition protein [Streptomyces sp. F8]